MVDAGDSDKVVHTAIVAQTQSEAVEVSILNVPAFLYKENLEIETEERGIIHYDISFGGSFFALVDADSIGLSLQMENVDEITRLGMELRDAINGVVDRITLADLLEWSREGGDNYCI